MTVVQSDELTWADIEADVSDYREGFVYVFLRYKGVKVEGKRLTMTDFAGHFGILPRTFQRWVKSSSSTDILSPPHKEQTLQPVPEPAEPFRPKTSDPELQAFLLERLRTDQPLDS